MSLQEWERDVINRQRNIVFPDTVLNQGRLYRNIVYGQAKLKTVHRVGILVLAAVSFCGGCYGIAMIIGGTLPKPRLFDLFVLGPVLYNLIFIALGIKLALRALLPEAMAVKKRRCHPRLRRP